MTATTGFKESFVMDDRGALVCMTQRTSDYWQGDEAKWQRSFNEGRGALYVGEIAWDESADSMLVQISVPIMSDGRAIGALTVGKTVSSELGSRPARNPVAPRVPPVVAASRAEAAQALGDHGQRARAHRRGGAALEAAHALQHGGVLGDEGVHRRRQVVGLARQHALGDLALQVEQLAAQVDQHHPVPQAADVGLGEPLVDPVDAGLLAEPGVDPGDVDRLPPARARRCAGC